MSDMTSKERIHKILNFETPDRIGIHDSFLDSTIENWKTSGLPAGITLEDYFNFDFEIFDIEKVSSNNLKKSLHSEKFTILSFSEPFQRLCDLFGREDALRKMAHHPDEFRTDLIRETERILGAFQKILEEGVKFDGAWAWGDLAYNNGLFFSLSYYKELLYPLHKRLFQFLNQQGQFVLFHSDGDIGSLIPYLLDAGVRAFHPLEENSGMDIYELIKDYRNDMIFIGCMDIVKLIQDMNKLKKKIEMLKKNSFYIYHADYPIAPNISFGDYSLAIESVRRNGAYY